MRRHDDVSVGEKAKGCLVLFLFSFAFTGLSIFLAIHFGVL